MNLGTSTEIAYLTWMCLVTALMWVPYILNMIVTNGLITAVGYSDNPLPMAKWAQRMKCAHINSVENLVVFAALVLAADALNVSTGGTAAAAAIYFWARIVHFFSYTFAVPWVRTLSFVVGFVCQVIIALAIL